jgi:Fe-S cluster biogenesis protein NfuA
MSAKDDEIRIIAEPQMDANVCSFLVDRQVHDGIVNCTSREMAEGSPLLEALFEFKEIRQVMVSGATITVAKTGDDDWSTLGKKVGEIIREQIGSGKQLIAPDIKAKIPSNDELRAKVQAIIDKEINPGLASHGGGADLIDVQGTTIFMSLSGGCQGCASAKYTLKHGIEQILREKIPEITEVIDVTDHTAGATPYY